MNPGATPDAAVPGEPPVITCDVAVIGSGAAGLAAAISAASTGASVQLFEKSDLFGGTTALSSGTAWIPTNEYATSRGVEDSPERAREYLEQFGEVAPEMVDAIVTGASEAITGLERHSPLRWLQIDYPDYHPERRGGLASGRTLLPKFFDAGQLGALAKMVRTSPFAPPAYRGVDLAADGLLSGRWANGYALVGALLKGCLDAGVTLYRSAPARQLLMDGSGVRGVVVEIDAREVHVAATGGVVLASGGYEWNAELVRAFLRGPLEGAPGTRANTGDGLLMAMEAGAQLGNMSEAWWMPMVRIPGEELEGGDVYRMTWHERALPGSIIVNRHGRRFVNEAHNYSDIGRAFHEFDANTFEFTNLPAWLVFDDAYFREYGIPSLAPGADIPAWLPSEPTLGDLARSLGIDAKGLEQTVVRFNTRAAAGSDPDFSRGLSVFDTFHGDERFEGPFRTLRPLTEPPFHALRLYIGALGTSGGPRTTPWSEVLDVRGRVIGGLYAAGNVMASATNRLYPGAGGTIGLALTFGYRAGQAAAGRAVNVH